VQLDEGQPAYREERSGQAKAGLSGSHRLGPAARIGVEAPPAWQISTLLQGAFRVGPLAASQATTLIVDPLASIALGIELFHERLAASAADAVGATVSLAVLAAGMIMLSMWAPPVMTAEELAKLPGLNHKRQAVVPREADVLAFTPPAPVCAGPPGKHRAEPG
jgi:hypothetical protein